MTNNAAAKTIDADTYSVFDYRTGDALPGAPTEELVKDSLGAGESGAVLACYSDADGWDVASEDRRAWLESNGYSVKTVFVRED